MNKYANLRMGRDHRGVVRLELNRPEKHNALNEPLLDELRAAVSELAGDDSVRVVVLAAAGKMFCAGGDLAWVKNRAEKDGRQGLAETIRLAHLLDALDGLPKPLIGRVQGDAFGGGVALMAVCDSVVAAEGAMFAFPETRIGLIPAVIAPTVIRRIGEGRARRYFMSGKRFDARQALEMGLVSVLSAGDIDALVEAEVADYLACAPGAVAEAKALCRRVARDDIPAIADWTIDRLFDRWQSAELREGLRCFFADERPPWSKS